ncbi:MFS transporter [Cellulomonas sp. APG4]|uniref:MFS transporter n=1 Tax=Cellulomonas sp. APG4 TaxID=1538656 RepID=UPI00137AAF6C|nr:MFS transporter [Cellulomonas sp. APG4]NCT91264.1 MFS transporter [Cellulomonas sp. APG4]
MPSASVPSAARLAVLGVLYWSAHTMLRPLIGPYVLELGGTAAEASLALASFAVLPTLLAVPLGALTDRWGVRRLLVGGGLVMVGGGAVLLLPGSLGVVVASQALVGVGTLAVWVALQTVATLPGAAGESPRDRNARIATFSLFLAAGQAIGPGLGGALADAGGPRLAFATFTGVSVLLVVLALTTRIAPRPVPVLGRGALRHAFPDAWRLMRDPAVLATVVVSFTALVVLDVRTAYHPLLLAGAGLPQWQIGALLSVAAAAGFASRPFFPLAMARLRASTMVGLVLVTSTASVVAVVLVPGDLAVLTALAVVNGFALGFAQPLTLSLMADLTPPHQRGLASGLRSTANRGAQLANPATVGLLTGVLGLAGAIGATGALVLVVAAASTVTLARHERAAARESPAPVLSA